MLFIIDIINKGGLVNRSGRKNHNLQVTVAYLETVRETNSSSSLIWWYFFWRMLLWSTWPAATGRSAFYLCRWMAVFFIVAGLSSLSSRAIQCEPFFPTNWRGDLHELKIGQIYPVFSGSFSFFLVRSVLWSTFNRVTFCVVWFWKQG